MLRDTHEAAFAHRSDRHTPQPEYIARPATCAECGTVFTKYNPAKNTCSDPCRAARDERIKVRAQQRQRERRRAARQ